MKPVKLLAPTGLAMLLAACGVPAQTSQAVAFAHKGDLVQSVTATGTTVSANQAKLSFKIPGKLATVSVSAGDQVTQGQVLAELESSDLQAAVQQAQAGRQLAQAGVDSAQAKVAQVLAGAKPENIAEANAAADSAKQKLADMQAGGRPEQVGQAQAQLDAAQQKLQALQNGSRQEQVQQAQAVLAGAQAKLQALKDGPRPEQIALFQRQIDVAKNNLYAAQVLSLIHI